MSSGFTYDNRCTRCGNRGHVFWRESGYPAGQAQISRCSRMRSSVEWRPDM